MFQKSFRQNLLLSHFCCLLKIKSFINNVLYRWTVCGDAPFFLLIKAISNLYPISSILLGGIAFLWVFISLSLGRPTYYWWMMIFPSSGCCKFVLTIAEQKQSSVDDNLAIITAPQNVSHACVPPTPLPQTGCDTRSIFHRCTASF